MPTEGKCTTLQKPNLKKYSSPIIHSILSASSFIGTPSSVVFPRQVFDEVGLFDEEFRVGGDNDLYTRCLIAGYQPIFTEQPVAIQRKHNQGQITTDPEKIEVGNKGRIARLNSVYSSVEKRFYIVPI